MMQMFFKLFISQKEHLPLLGEKLLNQYIK